MARPAREVSEPVVDSEPTRGGMRTAMAVAALMALALAVRLVRLGAQGLWYDEAYTAWIVQLPAAKAWQALLADGVHPPLFYLVQAAFRGLARSEFGLRLPSALAGSAASPLLFLLADRWFARRGAWLAGLLAALSPFEVWHSQDARMYAMLATLNVGCMLTFEDLLGSGSRKAQARFVICHASAYALHYFALMLPFLELLFIILTLRASSRRLRLWIALQALSSIPLAAWVVALAGREANIFGIGWIAAPSLADLVLTLTNLTVGYAYPSALWQWLGGLLCIGFLLGGVFTRWPSASCRWLTALWAFVPLLLMYAFSLRRPVYVDRFVIGSSMACLLLIAAGASALPPRLSTLAGAALTAVFVLSLGRIWLGPGCLKEQWREAAHVLHGAGPGEVVALRVLQIAVPFQYYDPGPAPLRPIEVNRVITPIDDIARGAAGTWLVYWNPSSDPHALAGAKQFEPEQETDAHVTRWLTGLGPPLLDRIDLVGITLLHFGPLP